MAIRRISILSLQKKTKVIEPGVVGGVGVRRQKLVNLSRRKIIQFKILFNQSTNLYFLPMEIIDIYNYNDAIKIQMKKNNVRTYIHPTGIHILGWYMYT